MTTDSDFELRADQWHKMTLQQLNTERDKIVNKLTILYELLSVNTTAGGLYKALSHAQDYLNDLINDRSK